MDDPWGSPWAASDSDKDQKLASSPAKSDLAPPPRAFLSASNSPRIPAVLDQSPWGGDDSGSVEWGTPSEPAVHSLWAGGWNSSSPNLAATPRDDVLSKTSPIAWPGNVATPKPANGFPFQQPPPDPWASELSSRRASNDGASTPRLVVETASPVDAPVEVLHIGDTLEIEEEVVWDKADVDTTRGRTTAEEPSPAVVESEGRQGADEHATRATAPSDDVRLSVESAAPNREYQSSTPSNDNTDHEEERQDSPLTSIDEEPRPLRPLSRKTSGKVQELVVKFDSLARATSEEPEIPRRSRSKSPMSVGKRNDSDDTADFGDFEEADDPEPPAPQELSAAETAGTGAKVGDTPVPLPPPSAASPSSGPCPIATFGPLNFGVDPAMVNKLFTTLPAFASISKVDHEVPDHVVNDSFTEISERKTWYRISRLGSSRRHKAGDDESYRRVTWPPSTVHHETITIVRRWMEEDSIAGRVQLGGGISKVQKNMFGWDSTAEPVALDAVFGKRNSHSRNSSLQSLNTTRRSGIEGPAKQSLQSPTHQFSGSAGPAVASFGWSSGSPTSTSQTPNTAAKYERNTTAACPDPGAPTPQPRTASGPPLVPKPTINATSRVSEIKTSQVNNALDDAEDDEWGEMVSSPVTSQPNTTAPAVQTTIAASVSVALAPQADGAVKPAHSTGPVSSDPWESVDLSVLDSVPAKPAIDVPATPVGPKLVEHAAKGEREPKNVVADPSSSATSDVPHASLPTVGRSNITVGDSQTEQDEAAQSILANLPDLSYMLR